MFYTPTTSTATIRGVATWAEQQGDVVVFRWGLQMEPASVPTHVR